MLRAVMTAWLVCGVRESCRGHWSAGGGGQTGKVWSPAHLPASCLPLTPVLAPPGPYHSVRQLQRNKLQSVDNGPAPVLIRR